MSRSSPWFTPHKIDANRTPHPDPVVDEAAKIIEEGIAYRASDVDGMRLNGFGFPRALAG